jgi:hypothetical protein
MMMNSPSKLWWFMSYLDTLSFYKREYLYYTYTHFVYNLCTTILTEPDQLDPPEPGTPNQTRRTRLYLKDVNQTRRTRLYLKDVTLVFSDPMTNSPSLSPPTSPVILHASAINDRPELTIGSPP